jgi:hypothetical protein
MLASASRLIPWLLSLLHLLLLLSVALLHLLGLLLVLLFHLLPSCVIGILLRQALVVLLLLLLELLMLLLLFGVKLALLLLVFLVQLGIARVHRSRPIVRRNFVSVRERGAVGIVSRVWRTIGIVAGPGCVVMSAATGWRLPVAPSFLGGNNIRAAR